MQNGWLDVTSTLIETFRGSISLQSYQVDCQCLEALCIFRFFLVLIVQTGYIDTREDIATNTRGRADRSEFFWEGFGRREVETFFGGCTMSDGLLLVYDRKEKRMKKKY